MTTDLYPKSIDLNMKRCFKCQTTKPSGAFSKDRSRWDGLCPRCKECDVKKQALRAKTPKYKAIHIAATRKYEFNNSHAPAAWKAVKNAKGNGQVVPWPVCAVPECSNTKVHAHHADYSRPLDVVWLCPAHHKGAHKAHR